MANKNTFPCKDCKDRAMGCHGFCKRYKETKEKYDKKIKEIKYYKKREDDAKGFILDTHDKIIKRINKKW